MLNRNLIWKLPKRCADQFLWFSKIILSKLASPPSFCRISCKICMINACLLSSAQIEVISITSLLKQSVEKIYLKRHTTQSWHVCLFFHKYQSLQNVTRVWIFRSSWFFRRHWGFEYLNQTLPVQRFHGPHGLEIKGHKHDINPIPNILHVSAIFCKYSKQNTPTGNTEV